MGGLTRLGFSGVERGGGDGKSGRGGGWSWIRGGQELSKVSRAVLSPVIALSMVAWTYC